MLTRRELIALWLAASTAPIVNALAFGFRLWLVTMVVAYLAALVVGAPLFACSKRYCQSMMARSLTASVVAGLLAAGSLVALVLAAFPPSQFGADPLPTLSLVAIAGTWGLSLGLIAGTTLWLLLRRRIGHMP